ncbi:hypothetical protein [Sulfitobacter sp. JB4-11]|uniref:hypothetical protein n=1 Tax=Sulfitobacter rhodophyticola TaxID=3238304 RepID=UPI003D813BD9
MEQVKRVGPRAGALKYDLLTALTVTGLHGTPTEQTSLMRLCALITARYNWRIEEVSVGHAELARLWAVNDRTVKREMKRLMQMGVLTCIRPGVRGRVGAYRLNYRRIYEMSRPHWIMVGPDFEDRMIEVSGERTVVRVDFQQPKPAVPHLVSDTGQGTWGAVRRMVAIGTPRPVRKLVCQTGAGRSGTGYADAARAKRLRFAVYRDAFCADAGQRSRSRDADTRWQAAPDHADDRVLADAVIPRARHGPRRRWWHGLHHPSQARWAAAWRC